MEHWYVLSRQLLVAAWRQRWLLVGAAWGVCLIGWAGIYTIPDSYESQARLYVDADAILTPLLRGLAIDTATANQLEIMQKTLLSRPNLDKLIAATDLNLSVTNPQQREQLIQRLGHDIKVTAEGRNLFTVAYRNASPRIAHDVIAALVNVFMDQANASNRADMDNAQKFLNQQIASYEVQLRAAENRRADFRQKYLDILPLESNGGVSRLDNARVNVRDLESELKDAIARREALQEEARITPPVISRNIATITSSQEQLAAAEAKLADLRVRFTDQHPDVVAARQLVASLKANPKAPGPAQVSGGGNAGPALVNPVYEQVKLRLIEADGTISSLRDKLEAARTELGRMEELARAAPQVTAQYEDLDRGYNVLRKNYEELLARRESSRITAAADTGADKVRLRIIDPPQTPTLPVAPDRFKLISLALLAGIGGAMGLAILLGRADQAITEIGRLREFGVPVLGGISAIPSLTHRRKLYPGALAFAASVLLLFAVYGALAGRMVMHHQVLS